MTSTFDPLNIAAALGVLDSELRDELAGEDADHTVHLLRAELANVATRARAWVERQNIPIECIPEPPEPHWNAQQCRQLLLRLAAVLQCLGTLTALSPAGVDPHDLIAATERHLMMLQGETLQLNHDLNQLESSQEMTSSASATFRGRIRTMLEMIETVLQGIEKARAGGEESTTP
jgi:hypothetical protein